jgi:hypothetical protein
MNKAGSKQINNIERESSSGSVSNNNNIKEERKYYVLDKKEEQKIQEIKKNINIAQNKAMNLQQQPFSKVSEPQTNMGKVNNGNNNAIKKDDSKDISEFIGRKSDQKKQQNINNRESKERKPSNQRSAQVANSNEKPEVERHPLKELMKKGREERKSIQNQDIVWVMDKPIVEKQEIKGEMKFPKVIIVEKTNNSNKPKSSEKEVLLTDQIDLSTNQIPLTTEVKKEEKQEIEFYDLNRYLNELNVR